MKLFIFACAALYSLSSFAADPKTVDFSSINLIKAQLLDDEGNDVLMYKLKVAVDTPADVIAGLEEESGSKIVSPLFDLDETSNFKNVYYYIGKKFEDGELEFVTVYINEHSHFVVDMDIVNAESDHLDITHGTPDEPVKYTLSNPKGGLFKKARGL